MRTFYCSQEFGNIRFTTALQRRFVTFNTKMCASSTFTKSEGPLQQSVPSYYARFDTISIRIIFLRCRDSTVVLKHESGHSFDTYMDRFLEYARLAHEKPKTKKRSRKVADNDDTAGDVDGTSDREAFGADKLQRLQQVRLGMCSHPSTLFFWPGDKFQKHTASMAPDDGDALKEEISELVFSVCYQLFLYFLNYNKVGKLKFDAIADENNLLKALSHVFIPRPPSHGAAETAHLDVVVGAFGHMLTADEIVELYREYTRLMTVDPQLYEKYAAMSDDVNLLTFYMKINEKKRQCPVFATLAREVCQIKASQAGVERGFSKLALFKNKTTNSLAPETTEARFIIASNLPKIYTDTWDNNYFDDFKASFIDKEFAWKGSRLFASRFL